MLFDELVKTCPPTAPSDERIFYPGFMKEQPDRRRTWGIPFQRSTTSYWNKELFKQVGLDPNRPPQNWAELVDYGKKLTQRDAAGKASTWGVQVLVGLPVPGCSRVYHAKRRRADERRGHANSFRQARWSRRCSTADLSRASTRSIRPASSSGAPRRRIPSSARPPSSDHHRQPSPTSATTLSSTSAATCLRASSAASPTGGGNFYVTKKAQFGGRA